VVPRPLIAAATNMPPECKRASASGGHRGGGDLHGVEEGTEEAARVEHAQQVRQELHEALCVPVMAYYDIL